jgi:hypothetical protein
MNFIAGSLGVDCDFCHEKNFEADKLPVKSQAREMIRMVHRLNEEDFHGKTEITCFTCHRGQAIPSGLPVLGQRQSAAASAQGRPGTDALPSVGQVLDAYVKALGGQAALDGVKSRVMKTTKIGSSDFKETTEVFQQAPGKVLRIVRAQGYTTWAGFNGRQTWGYDSEKSYWGLLDSAQRLSLIQESEPYPGSRLRKQYAQVAVLAKERVGEREAYVVGGISPEGARESFSSMWTRVCFCDAARSKTQFWAGFRCRWTLRITATWMASTCLLLSGGRASGPSAWTPTMLARSLRFTRTSRSRTRNSIRQPRSSLKIRIKSSSRSASHADKATAWAAS